MKHIAFLFFISFFIACTQEEKKITSTTRTQVIMGTFSSISLETKHSREIEEGFKHLKELEHVLSSYLEDALVFRLNKERFLPTQATLKDILEKSKAYHKQTHGYFDITVGAITKKLYHFGEEEKVPTQKQLHQANLGIDNIHIDDNNIELKENITIDLGGIGKGYGVDSLASLYAKKGLVNGKIALSGDIRCLDACEVGIQNPFKENETIATLTSKRDNLSISTSGTYRRYVKEKKHHHLINPKTKTQGRSFVSVTIVAQADNTLCDVMATAISTMPKDVALAFVASQKNFGYILMTSKEEMIKGNLEEFVKFKHSP